MKPMSLRKCALFLLLVTVCCTPDDCNPSADPLRGTEGHACRNGGVGGLWFPPTCNGGLTCMNGFCGACGEAGQACCGSEHACDGSLFCNTPPAPRVREFQCDACGQPGQPCCAANYCPGGGSCNLSTHRCESSASDCTGSTRFTFGVVNSTSRCAEDPHTELADSEVEARMCAERALATTGREVATGTPLYLPYCGTDELGGRHRLMATGFTEDDRLACARAMCGNGCTAVAGHCP
jgi:hypothetical protein